MFLLLELSISLCYMSVFLIMDVIDFRYEDNHTFELSTYVTLCVLTYVLWPHGGVSQRREAQEKIR